ncbi:hypothetical protein PN417_17005 [Halorubrum ezzemoulense]|uniref:hypothetical protein n=1 Tax=Halorubrum ezzemoulense TaxID=337243 RepID=UPI00232D0951|nr:hypothetical protein [Halorubrum ezzemoulense]MDB9302609.1 hypothetical protein [Halorubrum ezzemoulense]
MASNQPLIGDTRRLARIPLNTDYLACQVCGQTVREGDDITAYAYRAAGEPAYEIGYIMCEGDRHTHPTVFTRGVREHVVTGHIGTCADTRTQSTAYVLLDPTVVVTSPTTTADPHVHPDAPTEREPEQTRQRDPTPLLIAVRERARSDGGHPDGGE